MSELLDAQRGACRAAGAARAAARRAARAPGPRSPSLLLCLGALIGFLLIPTYPIYDTEYYLLLGPRDRSTASCRRSRSSTRPTEHPLAVGFGIVLAIFGNAALRLEVLCAVASFMLLVVAASTA